MTEIENVCYYDFGRENMFRFFTYNKLKTRKWKWLSPQKRVKVFQKLENIQAKKQGRGPYTVVPKDLGDTNGVCHSKSRTIEIHTKFFQDPSLRFLGMATLFHEGRHAFQYYAISKKHVSRFSKAYKWKKNFSGYVTYEEGDAYSFYSMQPVERDANKYAIRRLRNFKRRYKREPLYKEALARKEAEFDGVKDLAKKELGLFYGLRVAMRNRKESKKRY